MQTPVDQSRADQTSPLDLPEPPQDWLDHSNQLKALIIDRIDRAGGIISFHDYMQYTLYEPGLGYYSGAAHKFGERGDFVTAPELSALFGVCLANFAGEVFQQGCARQVLEFGAGNGKLCRQLLGSCFDLEQYSILELSGELRQRQQEYLRESLKPEDFAKIRWLDNLPPRFDGLVIANEVLDAMPVHVVQKQQQWLELGISQQAGDLHWQVLSDDSEAVARIQQIEAELGELPEWYRTELNLNYTPWLASLAELPGNKACLIFDYGEERRFYYRPGKPTGTLRCYFQHRVHDNPLLYPGLQDVTADVDFDALADAAEAVGFELCGMTTQATFLLNHGLIDVAERLAASAATTDRLAIAQQVKSLTLPNEMGERFKAVLLSQGLTLRPLRDTTAGALHG